MRLILIFIIIGVVLVGCSSTKNLEQYKQFLSDDSNKYSIFIIDNNMDQEWNTWLNENRITNVNSIRVYTDLNRAKESYDFLKLERYPAFVVFNNKKLVLKIYNEADLVEYLQNNNPN